MVIEPHYFNMRETHLLNRIWNVFASLHVILRPVITLIGREDGHKSRHSFFIAADNENEGPSYRALVKK